MAICEICEIKNTKKWNFPCRDEDGMLAEVEIVCKDCHDVFCCCPCKRTRGLNFGDFDKVIQND